MSDLECHYGPAKTQADCEHDSVFVKTRGNKLSLVFPSFCFAWPQWIGASYIVYEFQLVTTVAWFALVDLHRFATPDYVLAVRTKGHRYKFWEDVGEKLFAPMYNGEPIYNDAVFEVWSTQTPGTLSFEQMKLPVLSFDKCACDTRMALEPQTKLWVAVCDNAPPPAYDGYSNNVMIFSKEKPCD